MNELAIDSILANKDKSDELVAYLKMKLETDFLAFVRYFFQARYGKRFQVNTHHRKIAQVLQLVYLGEILRLIINISPRYSKTEMVVINWIAWGIAKNPACQFIHNSYSDTLVLDNSAQIKDLIEMPEFQELWPVKIKQDTKSKRLWRTSDKGALYAVPTAGAVVGFGAGSTEEGEFGGAIVSDDPLKPDDADSDVERNKVNKRINTTIKTRTNSRSTPIVIIMQRLHDDDPSGFCLNGGTGETWTHLNIPAIIDGKALWPAKHTLEELRTMEKADRFTFSGQYMQQPIPDEGIFFSREKFHWYEKKPEHLNYYGSSDYAVTEGGGDFTEHGIFGIDPEDNIYLVDWWSGQTKSDVWIETQLDMVEEYDVRLWGGETGPIKNAVEPFLLKRMRQRKAYCTLEWMSHAKNSKEANARTFQALVEAGKVYLPVNTSWATDLLNQLLRFPLGKYDDKVDVCSIFARMINQMWKAGKPSKVKTEPERNAWGYKTTPSNWKVA
jgi:predicted phage terminase large subunit-like protein